MKVIARHATASGLTLLLFSVIGAALLSGTWQFTHTRIEASERAAKLALLAQTLPPGSFDNDLVRDARPLPDASTLGLRDGGQFYPARAAGQAAGVVLETIAPDGYAGEIKLLVGIGADGRVSGVRVTAHHETPGLGDYIERGRSDWIDSFAGRSLGAPEASAWKVRKDGGQFDYMAGATITPRAVIKAVKTALEYFAEHRTILVPQSEGKTP